MPRRLGRARTARQALAIGSSVRVARAIACLSAQAAADRAGLARSTWNRIEAGDASVTLATAVAAASAVGLDLVCTTYPGREPRLRDTGQLAIAQRIVSTAAASWNATLEERAGDHGEAIDLVFRGPTEILAIEIERLIVDYQAQVRRLLWKRDWLAARHERPVRLVLLVADTQRNRRALSQFAEIVRTTFPSTTREVMAAIRRGQQLRRDGMAWVRPPRIPNR
jgi:transcriptional regulator with XRE-family HTH domain